MKAIYFDCKNGISGDMAYAALAGLLGKAPEVALREHGHLHRTYSDIKELINGCEASGGAKEKALSVYSVIAEAEASVHGTAIEKVHFHEVGRDEAVLNVIGAAACMDAMGADKLFCSEICDGEGFIECSHGTITVPVPAVMAMRRGCDLRFVTDKNVNTEMVTPSGLAILIGLGAIYGKELPRGEILKKAVSYGGRKTGRDGGLAAFLIETC